MKDNGVISLNEHDDLLKKVMTVIIIIIIIYAHQLKATGRKTRLDIQNYGCNGNLLCYYHGVVERNRIFSWKGVLLL